VTLPRKKQSFWARERVHTSARKKRKEDSRPFRTEKGGICLLQKLRQAKEEEGKNRGIAGPFGHRKKDHARGGGISTVKRRGKKGGKDRRLEKNGRRRGHNESFLKKRRGVNTPNENKREKEREDQGRVLRKEIQHSHNTLGKMQSYAVVRGGGRKRGRANFRRVRSRIEDKTALC